MNDFEMWIKSYKVRSFPWIDGKRIYFNVQYFASGQRASAPPVWDKTVYITDNPAGRRMVDVFTDSLTQHVAKMEIPAGAEVTYTVGVE